MRTVYHQNYFTAHPFAPYCRALIGPKKQDILIAPGRRIIFIGNGGMPLIEDYYPEVIMSFSSYLETLPLKEIAKVSGTPPKNTVPFTGYPRQHPSEKHKLILVYDPLGDNPTVLEFRLEDVLFVEEVHSAVTENGEGVRLVKIWIRRGAPGVIMEPFEVNEEIQIKEKAGDIQKRFVKTSLT